MKTAVVFLVFNRPTLTARVFERIRAARPPRLFVVADGPRVERAGEAEKCAAVRSLIEAGVDWPCDVLKNYAESNLGCARRVSSGLDWVFANVEEAIILEDDCLPDGSFFTFCEELLTLYRYDERVGQIAGCSFLPIKEQAAGGYFLSRYPHCWGWATWRRAWSRYDHTMACWRMKREAAWLIGPTRRAERRMWARAFDDALVGKVDSWAYRWTLALWAQGGLSANSRINLVSNLGFGNDATHTREGIWGNLSTGVATVPAPSLRSVEQDKRLDAIVGRRVFEGNCWWRRVIRLAKRLSGL